MILTWSQTILTSW